MSAKETWLGQLSDVCVCFITLACIEGFAVGYLRHRHDAASLSTHQSVVLPSWARYIVRTGAALKHARISVLRAVSACLCRSQPQDSADAARGDTTNANKSQRSDLRGDAAASRESAAADRGSAPAAAASTLRHRASAGRASEGAQESCGDSSCASAKQTTGPSWEDVGDALDDIARTTLPATFTCILIAYLADTSA